ncbi:hypothetical protein COCSADRAFT_344061 [Bipolaris sorokiniana ND90Pr]|uniref:Fungal calcium binding protein domain-containing protein n=1 Tax=Cochliobolus sativus (strain ND90Pr / ATCC 201652) TaxID=665912 RepID=M2R218_COCSN|nr:uncharacterized protein COCSADRAFT_344061 [Bipolaris sorokiniana ND90Pr]EMD61299.1 hypothetical protein COCSADRAFT_344061 [Bipolaris sorokiniana ND90Pr]
MWYISVGFIHDKSFTWNLKLASSTTIQLKFNAIGLLAILPSLTSAMPIDQASGAVLGERAVSKLEARQVQYSCQIVPANQVGRCRNAIADLRRRELRGCDVFACISAGVSSAASCAAAAAAAEGGLNKILSSSLKIQINTFRCPY